MSWHGNEYGLRSGRGRQRLAVLGLAGLTGLFAASGCATSPGVAPNGMPKLGRYASPAQLDWMLGRYEVLAQATPGDNELREEACLGWERAVFDLQSGQRYPMLLRMSNETTNLANLWQDLPILARRHPRPSSCDEPARVAAPAAPVVAQQGQSSPAAEAAPVVTPGDSGQGVTSQGNSTAVAPVVAAKPAAPPAASGESQASVSPSAPPAVVATAAPAAESLVVRQRRELTRLRTALGMNLEPSPGEGYAANPGAARTTPSPDRRPTTIPELDDAALQVLTELAESDLPPIRLRARFHLLGLCTRAVEAADRYVFDAGPAQDPPAALASQKICGQRSPKESLRRGQKRLLWSLLKAWRAKYPEPMGDIVIGLASFASRDNPLVDGPRVSR